MATEVEARMACANWLNHCLSIGWKREDLDRLEAIWWQFHDKNGTLISETKEESK